MERDTSYLLKYVSSSTYNKIIEDSNDYVLELLHNNFINVDLNIKYLIKYGISNIEIVIVNMLTELTMNHDDFIEKIHNYEKKLTKEEVITLIENM